MIDPAQKSKYLNNELKHGRLSQFEFQKECAYWLAQEFEYYQPIDIPPKPDQYKTYEQMGEENRKKLTSKYFKDNPLISWYTGKVRTAIQMNWGKIKQLRFFKKHGLDNETREKYHNKIRDFIKKIRYIYKVQSREDELDDSGLKLKQEFQGRIVC